MIKYYCDKCKKEIDIISQPVYNTTVKKEYIGDNNSEPGTFDYMVKLVGCMTYTNEGVKAILCEECFEKLILFLEDNII